MIFLGDIASPTISSSEYLHRIIIENASVFSGKRIICNLEGLIYDGPAPKLNEPILYNHSSVLQAFGENQKPVLCLANNHILDLPLYFRQTSHLLDTRKIPYCGAGRDKNEAEKPIEYLDFQKKVILFNVCWDFLLYNHKNPRSGIYVAELEEGKLIERVKQCKKESPDSYVVVYLHWSFDLETLPFPMYRNFARELIDKGVNVVVGAHSHCVQGGEKHKHGFIIYGLGNFFIPQNQFIKGKLVYPEFALVQLAFEWKPSTNEAICHWFRYQYDNSSFRLLHLSSEDFSDSKMLNQYTPYKGMTDKEYLTFYKNNRRKKFLIPVYVHYRNKNLNKYFTISLKMRARFARFLAKHGFRKWLN